LAQIKAAAKRVDRSERGSDEEYLRETMAYMPSRLTMEMVEQAFRDWIQNGCPGTMQLIINPDSAWAQLERRLRQQMGGGHV